MVSLFTDGSLPMFEKELFINFEVRGVNDFSNVEQRVVLLLHQNSRMMFDVCKYLKNRTVFLPLTTYTRDVEYLTQNKNILHFITLRIKDTCLNDLFYTISHPVAHLDVILRCRQSSMSHELLQELCFVHRVVGRKVFGEINLKISRNCNTIHATMYCKKNNFTGSILITTLTDTNFDHCVKIIDMGGTIYTVTCDVECDYFERFGASLNHIINSPVGSPNSDMYYDVLSKVKVVRGFCL